MRRSRLSPSSNLLPLLLVREVNKAEGAWLQNQVRQGDVRGSGAAEARTDQDAVGQKRLALIKRIAHGNKAFKPYLWQIPRSGTSMP